MDAAATSNVDTQSLTPEGISPMDAFASPDEPEARPSTVAFGSTTTREITMDEPEIQQDMLRRCSSLVIPNHCADGVDPRKAALAEFIMHSMDDGGIQDFVSQATISAITRFLTGTQIKMAYRGTTKCPDNYKLDSEGQIAKRSRIRGPKVYRPDITKDWVQQIQEWQEKRRIMAIVNSKKK